MTTASLATPPTVAEVTQVCARAEDPVHCGRLIEAVQLSRYPEIGARDDTRLTVQLRRRDSVDFVDGDGRTFALWGYYGPIDAVVIYATRGDDISFRLVFRSNGSIAELSGEPVLAPDRRHIAIADFCKSGCENDIVLWEVDSEGARKVKRYRPRTAWEDVTVRWKDADSLVVERRVAGQSEASSFEFKLGDSGWTRVPAR